METVDVVVATFGDKNVWSSLAERAIDSAIDQTVGAHDVWYCHGGDLADARNTGAHQSVADWLIFLDADDQLDHCYIEKMLEGSGDVRQPSTLGVVDGVEDDYPVLIKPKSSILIGNHLVIGSMVRRGLFEDVGGFRPLPVLEDWDFWIRCALVGVKFGTCPGAIYRVHVQPQSRNQDIGLHNRVYQEIQQEYQVQWSKKFMT